MLVRRPTGFLANFDSMISTAVHDSYVKHGVNIKLGAAPVRIDKNEDGSLTVFHSDSSSTEASVQCDCVIFATGRTPSTAALNLEVSGSLVSVVCHQAVPPGYQRFGPTIEKYILCFL